MGDEGAMSVLSDDKVTKGNPSFPHLVHEDMTFGVGNTFTEVHVNVKKADINLNGIEECWRELIRFRYH